MLYTDARHSPELCKKTAGGNGGKLKNTAHAVFFFLDSIFTLEMIFSKDRKLVRERI
jgi:hypothetical protein